MKRKGLQILTVALVAALLCSIASATLGRQELARGLALSDRVDLYNGVRAVTDDKGTARPVQENYFVYNSADPSVYPIVAYGDTLYGRSTMSEIAKQVAANDLTIVAGINGAFFDLTTGLPYGMVVTDGVLRTSGTAAAVGFYPNGTAVIGKPNLKVTLRAGSSSTELFYNEVLTQVNGVGLYSSDYDTRTKNTLDSYNLILKPTGTQRAELRLNSTIELEIVGIKDQTKSCDIPSDGFVLSIAETSSYASAVDTMKAFKVGDKLTVETTVDAGWENVVYAVGGGDILIDNGTVSSEFTLDSAKKSAARTAVGIMSDGSILFYTADGGTNSAGLTLAELADRMREAGCRYALNLDGGGSTAAGAQYPGYRGNATVNRPEDGSLRACANFIFLVRKTTAAQSASRLYIYPYENQPVLPGAKLTVTTKAADANYMAAELPGTVTYSAQNGTIDEKGVLVVDKTRSVSDPYVTVKAQSGSLNSMVRYTILDSVTSVSVKRQGTEASFSKATLAGGSVTELTATASYHGLSVAAQDNCFTWSVSGDIGTIDENGTFKAIETNAVKNGTIQVAYGSTTTSIDVTIAPSDPFADMKNHWAKDFVNDLYFSGVLAGSAGSDGKQRYRPDDSMTRQEFVVALMRYLGVNTSDYSSVKLPFDDTARIDSWALDAMKAAYSLKYMGGSSSGGKLLANPTSTISRQEAMTILSRTQTLPDSVDLDGLSAFSDMQKIASWAKTPLAAMVQMKIIGGSNGKLNPIGNVTRAEVAKMLYSLKYYAAE